LKSYFIFESEMEVCVRVCVLFHHNSILKTSIIYKSRQTIRKAIY